MKKFFTTKPDITEWLDKMEIIQYTLIPSKQYGFVVDVEESVDISNKDLLYIPVKFRRVACDFDCRGNLLKNLKGSPECVSGDFFCHKNQLVTLKGMTQEIGGSLICDSNRLTSLAGAPGHIPDNFSCSKNLLSSLEHCPDVGHSFWCDHNHLTSLQGCPAKLQWDFHCNHNDLTSLEFCPQILGESFYCSHNQIANFLHCPQIVKGNFYCDENPGLGEAQNTTKFSDILAIHQSLKEIHNEKEKITSSIAPVIAHTKSTHKI